MPRIIDIPNFYGEELKLLFKDPLKYEKDDFILSADTFETIVQSALHVLIQQPLISELGNEFSDTLIVGDIHGDIRSFWRITNHFLQERVNSIVFLGDYVDRGRNSLAVLLMILTLQSQFPKNVLMLKGNHEDWRLNKRYGFARQLFQIYPQQSDFNKVGATLETLYDHLSIAAITPNRTLCVHGGIPVNTLNLLEINEIKKPLGNAILLQDLEQRDRLLNAIYQLQWNDPREIENENTVIEEMLSLRGPGSHYFGKTYVKKFLEKNDLKRLVRAHESSRGGYEILFGGTVIHIFSAEPYFGKIDKAYVLQETRDHSAIRDLDFEEVFVV